MKWCHDSRIILLKERLSKKEVSIVLRDMLFISRYGRWFACFVGHQQSCFRITFTASRAFPYHLLSLHVMHIDLLILLQGDPAPSISEQCSPTTRSGEPLDSKQGCQDNTEVLWTLVYHHLFEETIYLPFLPFLFFLDHPTVFVQGAENCYVEVVVSFPAITILVI
jgi:hypothetical protein